MYHFSPLCKNTPGFLDGVIRTEGKLLQLGDSERAVVRGHLRTDVRAHFRYAHCFKRDFINPVNSSVVRAI